MPAIEQPMETREEMPPEKSSRPAETRESTNPVTAGPLSGWGGGG